MTANLTLQQLADRIEIMCRYAVENDLHMRDALKGLDCLESECIGSGVHRMVFRLAERPWVVKVHNYVTQRGGPNRAVWNAYNALEPHERAWVATPRVISKRSMVLISRWYPHTIFSTSQHLNRIYMRINPIYRWDMDHRNIRIRNNGKPILVDAQPCSDWRRMLKRQRNGKVPEGR